MDAKDGAKMSKRPKGITKAPPDYTRTYLISTS